MYILFINDGYAKLSLHNMQKNHTKIMKKCAHGLVGVCYVNVREFVGTYSR